MKTDIDELVEKVSEVTGLKSKETVKLYALLVLIKGENITLEDVHDAWSVMMSFRQYNPPYLGHEHPSIVPFDQLSYETQLGLCREMAAGTRICDWKLEEVNKDD